MKKLLMLTLAGLFSAGAAVANEGVDFDKLDADGDGQLSRTEVAQNSELAAQFSTVDANGDGYLSQTETQEVSLQQTAAEEDQSMSQEEEDQSSGEDY
ncbi:MAG TPA: hypothetical protein VF267_04520 [Gammaproteobacteria bacterium]